MASRNCSSCGAALHFGPQDEVVNCQYCGASNQIQGSTSPIFARRLDRSEPRTRRAGLAFLPIFFVVAFIVFFVLVSRQGRDDFERRSQEMLKEHDARVDSMMEEHDRRVKEMREGYDRSAKEMDREMERAREDTEVARLKQAQEEYEKTIRDFESEVKVSYPAKEELKKEIEQKYQVDLP